MKTRFLLFFLLLFTLAATAQRNRTGINAIDQQHDMQGSSKPPTPAEQLDKIMTRMTEDLSLNGLQEAAIRNILKDQMAKFENIKADYGMNDQEKKEQITKISERTDKDIKALLDADQLKKYDGLKEDLRSGKKNRKRKRDREAEDAHE